MTLVLTRASRDYVLQVTDRLVTQGGVTQFDAISNKNVLYCATNGVVTLGYTGFAYLEGIPADQWIAEILSGCAFDRNRKPAAFISCPIAVRDIGQSLILLKERLEKVRIKSKWRAQWLSSSFDVCVSGWQWSIKRSRPIMAWLSKPPGSLSVELGYMPRHWYWVRDPQRKGFRFEIVAAPASNLSEAKQRAMAKDLANCNPDQAERIMVEAIREVSLSVPAVGPHCMSILLSPPNIARARIRYLPLGGPALAVVSPRYGPELLVPAAFTPWLVGAGGILSPSINSGNAQVQIGYYTIALEAPKLTGPGIRGLLSSQNRPESP